MAFWFISGDETSEVDLSPASIVDFRSRALETTMYYVDGGEAIVVSYRGSSILIDGGEGNAAWNDELGNALAQQFAPGSLRAILATHPHRDHTNSYRALISDNNRGIFSDDSIYFDNGTQKAVRHWNRMIDVRADLPFAGEEIIYIANAAERARQDRLERLPRNLGRPVHTHLLRGRSRATTDARQAYWSVFMVVRIRGAALLFTGDVGKGYERSMLDRLAAIAPRMHLLKITHHGSHDGTSRQLVSRVRPGVAISSSNDDAKHDLSQAVIDTIEQNSSAVIYSTFDTNRNGPPENDIIVRTDGETYFVDGEAGVILEVETRDPVLQ